MAKTELAARHLPIASVDSNARRAASAPNPPRRAGGSRAASGAWEAARLPHAVGVGRKIVQGKLTTVPRVRLYVSRKLPHHALGAAARLPAFIDGIPTDVVQCPPAFFAGAPLPCSTRKLQAQRPALGGISGGLASTPAATLAARCRSLRPGEAALAFVLGNCHTLAAFGSAPPGSAIVQPSLIDGGSEAEHRLAKLHRWLPIAEGGVSINHVDAAIAQLDHEEGMSPGVCTLGQIQGTTTAGLDARIHKHGRTSGFTAGIVDDPCIDVVLPLDRDAPGRVARFVDQLRIRPLPGQFIVAQPGDSGALVLTRPGNAATGLLFACPDDGSFAYANPIGAVLEGLEIELA